jgi:hypothetical protein
MGNLLPDSKNDGRPNTRGTPSLASMLYSTPFASLLSRIYLQIKENFLHYFHINYPISTTVPFRKTLFRAVSIK